MLDLVGLTLSEASRAIRRGEITSERYTQQLLARATEIHDLNAFTSLRTERVLEEAHRADQWRDLGRDLGPLHGVPICLKDNIHTADGPTTAGTPSLRDHYAMQNAPVTQAILDAGCIVMGKNNMQELAFGVTCNNAAFGPIMNPYNPACIPGGSSGGTAVAVAARACPAGIGTDTGGSVRVPAALCGVTGFRPTVHRWSQEGIVPIAATRDTAGPIARSVEDLMLLDQTVTGRQSSSPLRSLEGIRLGVPEEYFWEDLDAETEEICKEALERLRDAGVSLIRTPLEDLGRLNDAVSFTVALYEARIELTRYLERWAPQVRFEDLALQAASPDVATILRSMLKNESHVSLEAYLRAVQIHRPRLISIFRDYFAAHRIDAIAYPTTPKPACLRGEGDLTELAGVKVSTFGAFIRNTDPGSNAGLPGVTLALSLTNHGLPVGLALDALPDEDDRLLVLCSAIETILPDLPPPYASDRTTEH